MASCIRITGIELELLTDIDILLMVEKRIRDGICYAICQYAQAHKKVKEDYGKTKALSFHKY